MKEIILDYINYGNNRSKGLYDIAQYVFGCDVQEVVNAVFGPGHIINYGEIFRGSKTKFEVYSTDGKFIYDEIRSSRGSEWELTTREVINRDGDFIYTIKEAIITFDSDGNIRTVSNYNSNFGVQENKNFVELYYTIFLGPDNSIYRLETPERKVMIVNNRDNDFVETKCNTALMFTKGDIYNKFLSLIGGDCFNTNIGVEIDDELKYLSKSEYYRE